MSAKKATKKELKQDGLVKGVFNLVAYVQEHSNVSMIIAGVIILIAAVIWGFNYSNKKANEKALDKLGIAQLAFGQGQFAEARDSLNAIVSKYSRTDAAKISQYYLGYIEYINGSYDLSMQAYEKFLKSKIKNDELKASAVEGIGLCYEGKGDYKKAAEVYSEVVNKYPNYFNNEEVIIASARAYKEIGDINKAIEIYDQFLKKYPKSTKRNDVEEKLIELKNGRVSGS